MRLVTYRFSGHGSKPMAGVLEDNAIFNAGLLLGGSAELSMQALLDLGPAAIERLRTATAQFGPSEAGDAGLPEQLTAPVWLSELEAPLPRARTFRDFYAYEQHVAAGYAKRNRPIPPAWFETPVFFFQYSGNFFGSNRDVPYPAGSEQLDFELEIAAIIGRAGRDIAADAAWDHVAGLTVLNDWSARDLQQREMSVGLGPAKAKDFATSIGPAIVTLDELTPWFRDDRHHLPATVTINDNVIAQTNAGGLFWSLPQMIESASRGVDLAPGDVIGFGTMARGCLLELGQEIHPWLQPGDEIILDVEGLGRLRNVIGERG